MHSYFLHHTLCFNFHRTFAKCISLCVTEFFVLPHSEVSANNKDITLAIRVRRWRSALSGPPFPLPPTLLFAFYLRQLIICYWSVRGASWFATVTSEPAAAIKQRNEQISKLFCWYPYLRVDSIRCISELAGQWIICTPVTSTSSSACNLSFERRCRLCSPPGSLGDVWQCADRYDYP